MSHRTFDGRGVVHVADFGGSGPRLVLLHGLGSSHAVWLAAGPMLAERARVVAVDLAGFGFTPLGDRSASVRANSELLGHVIEELLDGPAVLIGNSMGGVVSMLHAASCPDQVAGLVLVSPGLRRPRGHYLHRPVTRMFGAILVPVLGEVYIGRRWGQLGPEGIVQASLEMACVHPERVSDDVVDEMVEVVRHVQLSPQSSLAYLEASRSLVRYVASERHNREVLTGFSQPTLLLHGEHDRLVPLAAAEAAAALRPDWAFEVLRGIGHLPQIEAPDSFVGAVTGWLDGVGEPAARLAAAS